MSYDVKVNIDLAKPIGKSGFGVPLILIENATEEIGYTEVSNIDEAVSAGVVKDTDAYKAIQLLFSQPNAPKRIAVCGVTTGADDALTDPILADKGWRQLIVISESDESATAVKDISAVVEALDGKLFFAGFDTDDATTLSTTGMRRTVLFYCDATEEIPVPVAALVGETAGRSAGSFTYKNTPLAGIAAQELTNTEIETIHAKGGITFITKAGDSVTSEGKLAGGEYIDVIDCEDYIIQQMTYKMQKILNNAAKVPYDNNGIAMLETCVVGVLQDAFNQGMIARDADGNPDYEVNFALREDTKETDRANRRYMGGSFRFALAGAIHEVEITGTITA